MVRLVPGSGSDRIECYQAAVAALDPMTREVFRLHLVDDLGYGEIGWRLGLDVDAVERHVAAALMALFD
jgi:DNA-directed RNA polymerase specialized sigma24 family protein